MAEHLCAKCNARPGTEIWAGDGGTMNFIHGFYSFWCRVCVLTEQLKYARERAAAIPDLEAQLAEARAVDAVARPDPHQHEPSTRAKSYSFNELPISHPEPGQEP